MSNNVDPVHWGIVALVLALVISILFRAIKRRSRSSINAAEMSPRAEISASSGSGFKNPANGYTETLSVPFLWCLLFGCFYLAYKGAWVAACMAFVLAIVTGGFSWLIFPFFARGLVRKSYLQRGWIEVGAT